MSRKYLILSVIFFFIFVFPNVVSLLTDWFWFEETGFENIFITILSAKIILGSVVGLITFGLIYLNLKIACRLTQGRSAPIASERETTSRDIGKGADIGKHLGKIALFSSLIIGFFTGLAGASNWSIALKYLNSSSFGVLDPIFNRDISFYFFTLPFLKMALGFLIWIAFILTEE